MYNLVVLSYSGMVESWQSWKCTLDEYVIIVVEKQKGERKKKRKKKKKKRRKEMFGDVQVTIPLYRQ